MAFIGGSATYFGSATWTIALIALSVLLGLRLN